VAIDARKVDDFGIGTYVRAHLDEFAALGEPAELMVYLPPGRPPTAAWQQAGIAWRGVGARPYSLAELWTLAGHARRDRVELFHAPHYVCPPLLPCPAVITIHDLIHLRLPAGRPRRARVYARVMLALAVRRAARVIVVSESTRRDLETILGAAPERIRVIPNGVGSHFRPAPDPAAIADGLRALAVAAPYFLFVGNPLPHKNLPALLEAFRGLPPGLGRLVLAGIPPGAHARVAAACQTRALEARVTIVPPLPEASMPLLYQGATALVCPSLWEGFGLPALEAMACGTPVLAADRGALPEVVGDAGILVDPANVDALREGLYTLAVQGTRREALRLAGLSRARQFSWRRSAEATLAVYREVLRRSSRVHQDGDAGRAGP
jgi:glycosyltransferase involved in cell wall biosynthesis